MEIRQHCLACGKLIEMVCYNDPEYIRCPFCSNDVPVDTDEQFEDYLDRALKACEEYNESMGEGETFDR